MSGAGVTHTYETGVDNCVECGRHVTDAHKPCWPLPKPTMAEAQEVVTWHQEAASDCVLGLEIDLSKQLVIRANIARALAVQAAEIHARYEAVAQRLEAEAEQSQAVYAIPRRHAASLIRQVAK